ncbi:MAG TPA: citryl-CoA lyase [Sphingomonas sp.]|nr:citryl-CoA lyase [Sphingomonas sp.]
MKIGPDVAAITRISGSNPKTIIVRGRDLAGELIGKIGFTEHVWLLLTGELPDKRQQCILDATLVAIAEHGLVPSVVAARMTLAAAPEAVQGAVAAGLLGCGSVILGSAQDAGDLLTAVVAADVDVAVGAHSVVTAYREQKRPIPGYGHPLHKDGDPRSHRLFALARELGAFGRHCEAAHAVERVVPEIVNRQLAINVSSAIPAVLLDVGYPLRALRGVPLLARTGSIIAHLLEEQASPIGFHMANAASAAITYTGPKPGGFVADEN